MNEDNLHDSVPVEVLSLSTHERIEYFKNKFVAHNVLIEARDRLMQFIHNPGPTTMIAVYGPPGAGKTTLCNKMREIITNEAIVNSEKFIGRIPAPGVLLDPSDNSRFDWSALYYKPALESLHEPLIDQKIAYEIERSEEPITGNLVYRKHVKRADLRSILINTLEQRRPTVFWVDDAQYLTKVSRGSRLIDQIDSIKGLSDRTKVLHILFGTYDLLPLIGLRPEVVRRTHQIHLRRYNKGLKTDWKIFVDALFTFQKNLPLKQQPELGGYAKYFYEQSLGCIGILKDRLTSALIDALNSGSSELLPKHWESYETPKWELANMNQLIKEGEQNLQIKMGEAKVTNGARVNAAQNNKPKSGNQKPGERKPGHDPVGRK